MLGNSGIASLIEYGSEGLLATADAMRQSCCGDAVHLRGIIEFSNICSRDCAYCGLRRSNENLPRYLMRVDEILRVADDARQQGVRTIVLQSGESDAYCAELLAVVIDAIKSECDVAVTLCVGARRPRYYSMWRQAGADRYLIKHEAANSALYEELHPDSSLQERLNALEYLRALGYQTGTGNIIGLPGQTSRDLASDILLAEDLDVDMAAFGPFVPHPDTPLADSPGGSIQVSLRVVAVARLVLGPVHIPATTAFDAVASDGRERALRAGANVIMANITPPRYRDLYQIYPSHRALNTVERVKDILRRLDRPLAEDYGHSLKHTGAGTPCEEPQKV
ncbi:MAG: [FeFe] hydrogenase H-cluster radical SAM maturase HydE [Candidatus Brocadiae bacterium]|nr:[FeFe] hydrogenase H-cluster radical SAM maturase HydE [Candidatus Brocadiia bacterium]